MIPLRNIKRYFYKTCKQPAYAFRVLRKRLSAYFSYYFYNGKSSYPEAITLFLTHRCNLRCKMCGQWGEHGVTKKEPQAYVKEELSFDELKAVIDDVAIFKPNITLFGGEPLFYKPVIDLIKSIKKKKMHCLMITNGSLIDSVAEELVNSGLDELNVSLDAGRGLHDEIRGMSGLFGKITTGLEKVNYFKTQKGKKTPLINLQCTITKYNYKNLEQMLDVAKDIQANSLTFHNLIFLGKGLILKQKRYDGMLGCSSFDWEGFVFDPEIDVHVLIDKIKEIKKMIVQEKFSVDFYPNFTSKGIKEYYETPSFLPSEYPPRCISPWMVAYVFPDGQIRPCLNFDYSYGNVRKGRFTEFWNSQKAIEFRKTLRKNKIFPVCIRCTELYRY